MNSFGSSISVGDNRGPREFRRKDLHWRPPESPEAGIARVWKALVAAAGCAHGTSPLQTEIHTLRVTVKNLRALLRLLRPVLSKEDYRQRDHFLRDEARELGSLRDRQVAIKRLKTLRRRHAGARTSKALKHAIGALTIAAGDKPSAAPLSDGEAITGRALRALEESVTPFRAGTTEEIDGTSLVKTGLARTYRRARRELFRWEQFGDPSGAHDFRKDIKALMFQADFATPLDPARLATFRDQLEDLERLLGRHHDLVVLEAEIRALTPSKKFTEEDRKIIAALLARRLRKMARRARNAGRKLFSKSPAKFTASLREPGKLWKKSLDPVDSTP